LTALTLSRKDNGHIAIFWVDRYTDDNESYSNQEEHSYILMSPTDPDAKELMGSRHKKLGAMYINWAFAQYCFRSEKDASELWADAYKDLLFVRRWDGEPWLFYIHSSIKRERDELIDIIEVSYL
jgi:hypothetical protein